MTQFEKWFKEEFGKAMSPSKRDRLEREREILECLLSEIEELIDNDNELNEALRVAIYTKMLAKKSLNSRS